MPIRAPRICACGHVIGSGQRCPCQIRRMPSATAMPRPNALRRVSVAMTPNGSAKPRNSSPNRATSAGSAATPPRLFVTSFPSVSAPTCAWSGRTGNRDADGATPAIPLVISGSDLDDRPPPHAQEIERQERAAERERLMQRALEYAAQKREAERQRIMRKVLRPDVDVVTILHEGPRPPRHTAPAPPRAKQTQRKSRPDHAVAHGGKQAKLHTVRDVSKTMAQWAAFIGISASGLHQLIRRHGSLEAALDVPRRRSHRHPEGTGGRSELPSIRMGTGAGRTAQSHRKQSFHSNRLF